MVEVAECPLCKGNNFQPHTVVSGGPMIKANVDGFDLSYASLVHYVRCRLCGMVYQSPRMSDDELERWYSSGTYRKWLNVPQENIDRDEYERAERIYGWVAGLNPQSVLDIGCSRGYLLGMFGDREVQGVEQFMDYVSEDVPVVKTLDEVRGRYDAVTLIHVLEHVPRPVEFLREIAPHVGRYLYIEIPYEHSSPFRLAHLTYMEPWVLVQAAREAGLIFAGEHHGSVHTSMMFEVKHED